MNIINGSDGPDTLVGTDAPDDIFGQAGDDSIQGLGGDDLLDGGTGNDGLTGGPGNDTYVVDSEGDVVIEVADGGTDSVHTTLPTYTLGTEVENLTFIGTGDFTGVGNALDNALTGSAGNDILSGGTGNDTLAGGEGEDILIGGTGNDRMDGGTGADTMIGGAGNDAYVVDSLADIILEADGIDTVETTLSSFTLAEGLENVTFTGTGAFAGIGNALDNIMTGGSGNDSLSGGDGNDRLDGGAGDDALVGGTGNDTYLVDSLGDAVTEAADAGTDTVETTLNSYTLGSNVERLVFTGTGDFLGTGNALDNTIVGGDGNDKLSGGTGNDALVGGIGNDSYTVDSPGDVIVEADGAGTDSVRTSLTSYTLGGNLENLRYTGSRSFTGNGNALDNSITGGTGNDTLNGGEGNDRLNGGLGNDTLMGGQGNDIYVVDNLGDTVTEAQDSGWDKVEASLSSYTLGDDVEGLIYSGTGNFTGTGNGLDNWIVGGNGSDTLTGGEGNDRLDGRAGGDTLIGGLGNDTYLVDSTDDVVLEAADEGSDAVRTTLSEYVLADHVETLVYTGTGRFIGTGNSESNAIIGGELNDTLYGGDGNDRLVGGTGNDLLLGGDGDDTYVVDSLGDTVTEAADGGWDRSQTSLAAYALSDNVEGLTYIGSDTFAGTGNALDNWMVGGSGSDTLSGGDGNDRLDGGHGNDTLIGGLGNDTYVIDSADDMAVEAGDEGQDGVRTSLSAYTLPENIEYLLHTGTDDFAGSGNALDNSITGGAGNDILSGAAGDDRLDGQGGADTLIGGIGNDTYILDDPGDTVIEAGGEGWDRVRTSLSQYTLGDDVEGLYYTGSDNFTGSGNGLDNWMIGGAANDVLFGGDGNDRLDGGAGNDTLTGGRGNDTYVVDSTDDVVVEATGEGSDTVRASLGAYTLGSDVETLVYTGSGDFSGSGNSLANTIVGGEGNDTLFGDIGTDRLTGGAGADVFVYSDVSQSALVGGYDTIFDFDAASGDKIDLSAIDANSIGGSENDAFVYVGTADFSGTAGELRFSNGFLQGDTNGDGAADITVKLSGTSALAAESMIL